MVYRHVQLTAHRYNITRHSPLEHHRSDDARIEYKLLSLTYKVFTTAQPSYLRNLISLQPPRSFLLHVKHTLTYHIVTLLEYDSDCAECHASHYSHVARVSTTLMSIAATFAAVENISSA